MTIEVDGDYADCELADPEKATITLANVGDKAEVTVTYDEYDGSDPVVGKGTVVCVSAQATVGNTTYFTAGTTATKKIYLNSYAPVTTLYETSGTVPFYFTALDANGLAIEYDYYEIESSNEDVIGVDELDVAGKYASFNVTTVEPGTAKVIIKATKNEKETVYYGTVRVLAEPELKSVVLDKSSIAVSNLGVHDSDYVKVKLLDQYGAAYTNANATIDVVRNDDTDDKVVAETSYSNNVKTGTTKVNINATASGANGSQVEDGSYVIKVTVDDPDHDREIIKKFTVKVRTAALTGMAQKDYTYKVELDTTSVDLNPEVRVAYVDVAGAVEAKLAKYAGSVFVGYVALDDPSVALNKDLGAVSETTSGSGKYAVKYIAVTDTFINTTYGVSQTYVYYVPVNKTFTEK